MLYTTLLAGNNNIKGKGLPEVSAIISEVYIYGNNNVLFENKQLYWIDLLKKNGSKTVPIDNTINPLPFILYTIVWVDMCLPR